VAIANSTPGSVLGAATAFPQLSGNAVPNQLWAKKLIARFYDRVVFADISSTDYESEIKSMGDLVTIRTTPNITISNYTKGQSLPTEALVPGIVNLAIDQAKFFNFAVDDVDKYQMDIDFVNDWTSSAAEQMAVAIDQELLAYSVTGVAASNTGATAGAHSANINIGTALAPVDITAAFPTNNRAMIDYIVDHETVLDESNIPNEGRWMVLPPRACALIEKSAITTSSLAGGDQTLYRNGRLGTIGKFTIYNSNLLPTSAVGATVAGQTDFTVMSGHKSGLAFASQLTNTETIRSQSTFGHLVRGLNVYGRQVVKGDSIAVGHISI